MSCWEKTGILTGLLMWLLPPLQSVGSAPQISHMLFLISWGFSSQSWLLPWWAGLYLLCCLGPTFLFSTSPICPSGPAPSFFLYNLHPSQVGGAPRSGIYTLSKAGKKDQKDPREKRFPSLVLFIPPLLPLPAPPRSTAAALCVLRHSVFSCTCTGALPGKRGEWIPVCGDWV